MKKFMKFMNKKKDGSDTVSNRPGSSMGSRRSSAASLNYSMSGVHGGYEVKDKDLGRLHRAVMTGDKAKVHSLAQKEINAYDKQKRTALHLACAVGNVEIVQELLEWRPQINARDADQKTPLIKAIETKHADCAKLLLESRANATILDKDANSCFHYIARHGLADLMPFIIKFSKDYRSIIHTLNVRGEAALHVAVSERQIEVCRNLIEIGCAVDVTAANGMTALMIACQRGFDDLVTLLLTHRADTTLRDKTGMAAIVYARQGDHVACVEALNDYSAGGGERGAEGGSPSSSHPSPQHQDADDDDDDDFDDDETTEQAAAAASTETVALGATTGVAAGRIVSQAQTLDEWNDSDSESETNAAKAKKPLMLNNLSRGEAVEDLTNLPVSLNISPRDEGFSGERKRGDQHPPVSARSAATLHSLISEPWSDEEGDTPEPSKLPPPAVSKGLATSAAATVKLDSDDDWDSHSDTTTSHAVNKSSASGVKYSAPPIYLPGLGRQDSGTDSIGLPAGTEKQLPVGTGVKSSVTGPGSQAQISARSAASDWDTTTAPDDDDTDGRDAKFPPPPVILPPSTGSKDQNNMPSAKPGAVAAQSAKLIDTEESEEEESTWEKEQKDKKKVKETNILADKKRAGDVEDKQVNASVVLSLPSQTNQAKANNERAGFSNAAILSDDGRNKGAISKSGGAMGLHDSFSDSETSALDERSVGDSLRSPAASMSTDLPNVIRLQERVRESQRLLDTERNARATAEHRRKGVEAERDSLLVKLEELTRDKHNVDQAKIELEAKLRTTQYELGAEAEKRKSAESLLQKTKDQLKKKEDQYTEVSESLQSVELSLKTEQKEKNAAFTRIKQLEEEKQALYVEHGDKSIFVMNESANKEKDASIRKLEKETQDLKQERKELKEKHERLERELDDLRKSMRDKQEAVDKDLSDARLSEVKLKAEIESLQARLSDTKMDLQRSRESNENLERKHIAELDRYKRMLEQNEKNLNESHSSGKTQSETNSELLRKAARLEAELQVVNGNLSERSSRLGSVERELEERRASNKSLIDQLQMEKERNIRLETRVESLQDKLKSSQDEIASMRRQIDILRSADGTQADKLKEIIDSIKAENNKASLEHTEQLGEKLSRANERLLSSERRNEELLEQLRAVERSTQAGATSSDPFNSVQSTSQAKNVVDERMHELTLSNTRLEIELKHEKDKTSMLKKELEELKQANRRLNEDTEALRESNIQLQYQTREAEGGQTRASQQADESRTLLETELTSRSRLGLRLVQVERENKDLAAALEEERRRTRKALEKKKLSDLRFEQELERAAQLEAQTHNLKSNLRSAKKRVKLDSGRYQTDVVGAENRSNRTDSRQVLQEIKRLRNNEKLLSSPSQKNPESDIIQADSWISSILNGSGNRDLGVDEIRKILEERARQELTKKLREVNWYLEDQAVARDRLERIRDRNELSLRKDFERIHQQLYNEVGKLTTDQLISETDGRSLESHDLQRQRIRELLEQENKLRDHLNIRSSTAHSDTQRGSTNGNVLSQELEKSIKRHLENGGATNDFFNGSTEKLDSTSSDYLSGLKRKYLL